MITKRTLEKWRKEALEAIERYPDMKISEVETPPGDYKAMIITDIEQSNRILHLTQILLDQHLVRRK